MNNSHATVPRIILFGSPVALVIPAGVAFLPADLAGKLDIFSALYPPLSKLQSYCSDNPCLMDPATVASIYGLQGVLFAILMAFVLYYINSRVPDGPVARDNKAVDAVRAVVAVAVGAALLDYAFGHFSFEQGPRFPNYVTQSYLSLLRLALAFWAALALTLLSAYVGEKPRS